jgi:hypothetical protein
LIGVAGSRVLRQIAQLASNGYGPGGGQKLLRQHSGQSRFTGTIATDQPNLVAFVDAKRHIRHESSRSDANLETGNIDH